VRVLVTGSSGWLGTTLVPRLQSLGHAITGLDPVAAPTTNVIGSVADKALVADVCRQCTIEAIVHAGALHKPQVATHDAAAFIDVNVRGTLNVLEAAVQLGSAVDRVVFTSTTSLMIDRDFRERVARAGKAAWLTERAGPLAPRNVYGVTKLAAEHLCRMFHEQRGLPIVVLRTGRFFPEEDDMAHTIVQSEPNTKLNELLFRRLTVDDAAEAHVAALDAAPRLGFDTFIVSAPTPFREEDCAGLWTDAPSVVERYFPRYRDAYGRRGWTMFSSIDRVYVTEHARERLGFVGRTGFGEALADLSAEW
jgi:UDP-glucose 4-epimerase